MMEQKKQEGIEKLVVTFKGVLKKKKQEESGALWDFRFNFATGHPTLAFGRSGKQIKSVGLTHQAETFGRKNMPLKNNPNPNDSQPAFARNGIVSKNERYYGRKMPQYSVSGDDKANIKSKIRHYKKGQKKKK